MKKYLSQLKAFNIVLLLIMALLLIGSIFSDIEIYKNYVFLVLLVLSAGFNTIYSILKEIIKHIEKEK